MNKLESQEINEIYKDNDVSSSSSGPSKCLEIVLPKAMLYFTVTTQSVYIDAYIPKQHCSMNIIDTLASYPGIFYETLMHHATPHAQPKMHCIPLVGASMSEPHTSVTSLHTCVCMLAYLLGPTAYRKF